MVRRLWWKDLRQFGPIWAVVAGMAIVNQWLVAHYSTSLAGDGVLFALALVWTGLYAFAVSAAAFAGERETNTLRWLDSLSAPRLTVWANKAVFALSTTLLLGWLLYGTGRIGTLTRAALPWPLESTPATLGLSGVFLLEMVGWGLLFSALLPNALLAAALAIGATMTAVPLLMDWFGGHATNILDPYPIRLAVGAAAAGLSALLFTGGARRVAARPTLVRWKRPRVPAALAIVPAPMERPESAARRFDWIRTARSLAWKARREAGSVLAPLAALALGIAWIWADMRATEGSVVYIAWVSLFVAIVAGVHVFGFDTSRRSQRFLAYHGAGAGMVWCVENAVWLGSILGFVGLGLMLWAAAGYRLPDSVWRSPDVKLIGIGYASLVLSIFAMGELCGMAIRRGITAGLVALMAVVVVMVPLINLAGANLVGPVAVALMPLVWFFATWSWRRDWLLDRPGWRRHARLAALVVVGLATWFAGFTLERAFSLTDPGPLPEPLRAAVAAASRPVPPDQNAAETVVRLARPQGPTRPASERQTSEQADRRGQEVLASLRAASRMSAFRPADESAEPELTAHYAAAVRPLIWKAEGDTRRGDLDGAWHDILAALRLGRLIAADAPIGRAFQGVMIEKQAVGAALAWVDHRGQSAHLLRRAVADLNKLPVPTSLDLTIAREEAEVLRQLDLAPDELRARLVRRPQADRHSYGLRSTPMAALISTPWERERARRAVRLLGNELRANPSLLSREAVAAEVRTSPLATELFDDSAGMLASELRWLECGLRALRLAIALREYQIAHDGDLPESLDAIAGNVPAGTLVDPSSNSRFRYVPMQAVIQPHEAQPNMGRDFLGQPYRIDPAEARAGGWLLLGGIRSRWEGRSDWERAVYFEPGTVVFPVTGGRATEGGP